MPINEDVLIQALREITDGFLKGDKALLDVITQMVEKIVVLEARVDALELLLIKEGTKK
jgi:hypothetical protein